MRKYKSFDFFGQLFLVIVVLISLFFDESGAVSSVSLITFAVLQIISLLVHSAIGKQSWKENFLRKIHLIGTGVVILIMIYGMVKPAKDKYDMSGLGIIFYALIPGAVVALFYTVITFLEWKKLKNRS